jgi:hypothetical protein
VLATQALFFAQDVGASAAQRAQLGALLQAAAQRGYPIRVALIASSRDLGSVTELWHQPQTYARFLGQELALVYKGRLLVVMPDGFGLTRAGRPSPDQSVIARIAAPGAGAGLAGAATAAVRRLAAASGRPLPLPAVSAPRATGSSDAVSWIALGVGAVAIAAAWSLSLRARPLGNGQRSAETAP